MSRRAVVVPGRGQLVALFVPDGALIQAFQAVARFIQMEGDLYEDVVIEPQRGGVLHWVEGVHAGLYFPRDYTEAQRTIGWVEPEGSERHVERRGEHIAPVLKTPQKPVERPTERPREPIVLVATSVRLADDTLKVINAMQEDKALVIRAAVRVLAEMPERDRVAAVERNKWLEKRAGIGAASKRPQRARKK